MNFVCVRGGRSKVTKWTGKGVCVCVCVWGRERRRALAWLKGQEENRSVEHEERRGRRRQKRRVLIDFVAIRRRRRWFAKVRLGWSRKETRRSWENDFLTRKNFYLSLQSKVKPTNRSSAKWATLDGFGRNWSKQFYFRLIGMWVRKKISRGVQRLSIGEIARENGKRFVDENPKKV